MKQAILALIVIAAAISGCEYRPNYSQQVLDRPLPQTKQKRQEKCNSIRSEIARQQSLAQAGGAIATTPMMAIAVQAKVRDNIAALEFAQPTCNALQVLVILQLARNQHLMNVFQNVRNTQSRTKE